MNIVFLYNLNGKAHQIEHQNSKRVGIYDFESYESGVDEINTI